MKRLDTAIVWATLTITSVVVPAVLIVVAWRFISSAYVQGLVVFIAIQLLMYLVFGRVAADPRGGWTGWWLRERQMSSSRTQLAMLMLVLAFFWAILGVLLAFEAVKRRKKLQEHLDREDARLLKAVNGNS